MADGYTSCAGDDDELSPRCRASTAQSGPDEKHHEHISFGDVTVCRFDSQDFTSCENQGSVIDIYRARRKERRRQEQKLIDEICGKWSNDVCDDPFADDLLCLDEGFESSGRGRRNRSRSLDWDFEPISDNPFEGRGPMNSLNGNECMITKQSSIGSGPFADDDILFAHEAPIGRSRGRSRSRGQSWDGVDSRDLKKIACLKETEEKASASYRVKNIESGFAVVWKLNHTQCETLAGWSKTDKLPDDVMDAWNWCRRYMHLTDDGERVDLQYISEKFNIRQVPILSVAKSSKCIKIQELPLVFFMPMTEVARIDRWEEAHQHEVAVSEELMACDSQTLDNEPGVPQQLYPIAVTSPNVDSGGKHFMVLGLISHESRCAWMECLQKHLPNAVSETL